MSWLNTSISLSWPRRRLSSTASESSWICTLWASFVVVSSRSRRSRSSEMAPRRSLITSTAAMNRSPEARERSVTYASANVFAMSAASSASVLTTVKDKMSDEPEAEILAEMLAPKSFEARSLTRSLWANSTSLLRLRSRTLLERFWSSSSNPEPEEASTATRACARN